MRGTYSKGSRGRIPLRDRILRNQATLEMYRPEGAEPVKLNVPPPPKKRAPPKPTGIPLESEVQAEIVDELRRHPMVGLVTRVNSGSAVERNADGSERHIQFVHVYSVRGVRFRPADLDVTLTGPGHWAGKRFVIECKRPGWLGPSDERERGQEAYIRFVVACSGYGMFAWSWDMVAAELERIRRS